MFFNIYFWLDFVTILVRFWNPKSIILRAFLSVFSKPKRNSNKNLKKNKKSPQEASKIASQERLRAKKDVQRVKKDPPGLPGSR